MSVNMMAASLRCSTFSEATNELNQSACSLEPIRVMRKSLLSDYLNEHTFAPSSVEFAVENLFPRPEIQFAFGDRDDDFAAHDLTLEVGVSVVFASPIM